jgi:O-antigen biosynthesis protein WbqV
VLVIENSEPALHAVLDMLATKQAGARIEGRLADVRDRARILRLMSDFKPEIVFHAAALKHVPLLEQDWGEGVKTNVFGSVNVADAAAAAGAAAMVMSLDRQGDRAGVRARRAQALRGNVLPGAGQGFRPPRRQLNKRDACGSCGALRQCARVQRLRGPEVQRRKIGAGGPVTVTHPDMVRYFMTIREACDLVVSAASHALGPGRSDVTVYVLNMGQPVKILDLAERMIRLSGLEPGRDIDITITGIRRGERLQEILFAREEPSFPVGIEGIVAARPMSPSLDAMRGWLAALDQGLTREDRSVIYAVLRDAVPVFAARPPEPWRRGRRASPIAGRQPAAISFAGSTTESPPSRSHRSERPAALSVAAMRIAGIGISPGRRCSPARSARTISASVSGSGSATT